MKIYTDLRLDIDTFEVISEVSFEYDGEIAECKSGGGGGEPDKEYNRRMATIAEKELQMAQQYFNFWKSDYMPMEKMQIQENMRMMPSLTDSQIAKAKFEEAQYEGLLKKDPSGQSLLGLQQQYEKQKIGQAQQLMGDQTKVAKAAYQSALRGEDEGAAARKAQADVAHGFADAKTAMRRDMGRAGLRAGGEAYAQQLAGLARDQAKAQGQAMTTARSESKDKEFLKLQSMAGLQLGFHK